MTRRTFYFECAGVPCAATLDLPPDGVEAGPTGLLIVTGGNEVRSGPQGSQAAMAAHFAAVGFAVFRYDRRGVGDSAGVNTGWRGAETDLLAAASAFRTACPSIRHVVAYGNCDGASTLALHGQKAKLDKAILANPWVFDHDGESTIADDDDQSMAPAAPSHSRSSALRYYRKRLADPSRVVRDIFGGRVNVTKFAADAVAATQRAEVTKTAVTLNAALEGWGDRATVLLARDDRTAIFFDEQMAFLGRRSPTAHSCPTASHSFADAAARSWLYARIGAVLTAP